MGDMGRRRAQKSSIAPIERSHRGSSPHRQATQELTVRSKNGHHGMMHFHEPEALVVDLSAVEMWQY
jgi:hypothetical protein